MSKYGNQKTAVGGITFDSKREAGRWQVLKLLERAGEISGLQRQIRFVVIDKNEKFRECSYVADFVYFDRLGRQVVEDAKGYRTKEYQIKRKLMYARYGIEVREV